MTDIILGKRLEQNGLIQTVQKFRSEMLTQFVHHGIFGFRSDIAIFINALQQIGRPQITGHDDNGIFKVNRPAL